MSKFSQQIKAEIVGEYRSNIPWMQVTTVAEDYGVAYEYKVGVAIECKALIAKGAHTGYIVNNLTPLLIEEVFGEFRPILHRIERALIERNCEKAREELIYLRQEMFS